MRKRIKYFQLSEVEYNKLKSLLGIEESNKEKDSSIQFCLEDAYEVISNYCNTDGVAEGLYNTLFRIAIDLYRHENIGSEESSLGSVSSISEGDTSVSYRSSNSEFKESLLKDYKKQLNRYRKLVF
ncbi:hypothetical protein [Romboutsia lituseburensis]|uniref:hypothetical protein n=1 Tax=Romboutsia lituseburensis TaxID=1537 RepID=UPI0022EB5478|nr:hypothetical protein [Romboutsia lituseburensis]